MLQNLRVSVKRLSQRSVEFDLVGVDASIANAFRRILIAEVSPFSLGRVPLAMGARGLGTQRRGKEKKANRSHARESHRTAGCIMLLISGLKRPFPTFLILVTNRHLGPNNRNRGRLRLQ